MLSRERERQQHWTAAQHYLQNKVARFFPLYFFFCSVLRFVVLNALIEVLHFFFFFLPNVVSWIPLSKMTVKGVEKNLVSGRRNQKYQNILKNLVNGQSKLNINRCKISSVKVLSFLSPIFPDKPKVPMSNHSTENTF